MFLLKQRQVQSEIYEPSFSLRGIRTIDGEDIVETGDMDTIMQESEERKKIQVENKQNIDTLLSPNSYIEKRLRTFYLSVQNEGIPERFLALLTKLDQVEEKNNDERAEFRF